MKFTKDMIIGFAAATTFISCKNADAPSGDSSLSSVEHKSEVASRAKMIAATLESLEAKVTEMDAITISPGRFNELQSKLKSDNMIAAHIIGVEGSGDLKLRLVDTKNIGNVMTFHPNAPVGGVIKGKNPIDVLAAFQTIRCLSAVPRDLAALLEELDAKDS